MTSRNKGLSSNDQVRQRRESLGARLLISQLSFGGEVLTFRGPHHEYVFAATSLRANENLIYVNGNLKIGYKD